MSRPAAPTPTNSTTNTTPASAQKLRASCDACNQAKVKCTKDRPFCTRCATHGIYCVYSVSLRAGKRRAGPKSPTAVTPVTASQDQVMTDISPRQLHFEPLTFSPSPPAVDLHHHRGSNDMYHSMLNLEGASFDTGDHLHDFLDCSSPTFSHGHMVHQGRPLPPTRQDSRSDPFLAPPLIQHSSTDSDLSAISGIVTPDELGNAGGPHWGTSMSDELFGVDSRAGSQTPLDMFSYPSSAPLSRSPSATFLSQLESASGKEPPSSRCQCFQRICSMLTTLSQVSEPQRTTFDVALTKNKDAIAMCGATLRCRQCSNDTESVTMLVSLMAKIISVYKAPGSAYLNSINTSLPTLSRDSDDTISNGSSGSGHSYITYGSYRMDKEDDERLKMEIVAIELRKVESLIVGFRERFCGTQMQRPRAEHESRLYEAMVDFLAKRLRAEFERLNRRKGKTARGSSVSSTSMGIE